MLFSYGPIEIRFYGLMYVLAILVGSLLLKVEVRRKGLALTDDQTVNFLLWTVVCGVIGARIYYVVFNLDYYLSFPTEIPAVWHGGLAIHGGLIGGTIGAWVYLKRKAVPFWRASDACAPTLILGQSFGRFGNFLNGDAHGVPTDFFTGVIFPAGSIAGDEFPGIPIHPSMLYEMAINLSIFSLLWFVLRKREFGNGFIFAAYLLLYSTGRFFVEMTRADSLMVGPLRTAQVVSLALIAVVGCIVILKRLWVSEEGEA